MLLQKKYQIGIFITLCLCLFVYQGSYSDLGIDHLKGKYANENSQFLEIDELKVHYRDEGSGQPVILLHGTASSLHTWDEWAVSLKENYRVIRLDLPAFGLTGPNKSGNYSIEYYTEFLKSFFKKLNIKTPIYLAGNSLGGNIAWNYAALNSDQVDKLVLLNASGIPSDREDPMLFKLARNPVTGKLLKFYTPKFFVKKNVKEVYHDDNKISNETIDRYHDLAIRAGNRQALIDRAKTDYSDRSHLLDQITMPTLIIWGKHDKWIPVSDAYIYDSLISNSQLVVLDESGHIPMEEDPKQTVKKVIQFFQE